MDRQSGVTGGEASVFGETVRAHRRRLGLTQEDLAARTGVSVRSISDIEACRTARPRQGTVRLLADAFGLGGPDRDRFFESALSAVSEQASTAGPGDVSAETQRRQARPAPAQLPADVPAFTGRGAELAQLDALLIDAGIRETAGEAQSTVVISAVSGTAGVGKTALAARWAHRARGRFPDGQVYVNLRGYDPDQPMSAADALARFLTALGVAGPDIPVEVDERAARYRTEISDRRILIVLDNASSVEQVRPLLPGTGSCAVMVTSRDSMAGLVAVNGAHRLDLDLLPEADAVALLRRLVGPRVDAEPDAAAALANQCVRLPLALRVAAELAVSRPTIPLSELVAELADQQRRLDLLDAGGDPRAAVAAVFSWSYRHLAPDAAHTFRLLGLHPGPDLDAYVTAAVADTGLDQARHTLDQLTRAHLVQSTSPGRYDMHDLLRAYATRLATAGGAADDPRAALGRLFDYYLAAAAAAMDRLYPAEAHRRPRIPPAATPTPVLADPDTARAWLDVERPCLAAVAGYAAAHGWPRHAVRLSATLYRYLSGGHYTDALVVHGHARTAARQAGDSAGEAQALNGLGAVHMQLGRYEPAAEHLQQAITLFREAGDQVGQARALGNLGSLEAQLGRHAPATGHHERALALFRRAGDRVGEAHALNCLGIIEQRLGRYWLAADHHEQALAVYRQAGDRIGEAWVLNNLGVAEVGLGRHGPAADHHQHALALYRQLGNRTGEAWALNNLGTVHARLGRPEQAAEHYRQALTLFREIGDRDGEAWAHNGLGEAAHAAGRPADALVHHTVAAEIGLRDQQARAHSGLGNVHHALGNPTRAREHYQRALALYLDLGMPDADNVRAHLTALDEPPDLM
ncbi:MAG TPA: tetratricopeptide repeat protein [Planosporangium sp.]|jgi:tetratricopeptide (TPR) repeat protein/transcriptional regulator with XRE-family HTH domain|nr:tetratricopeptide repeat protein [Planosporangium sp.]